MPDRQQHESRGGGRGPRRKSIKYVDERSETSSESERTMVLQPSQLIKRHTGKREAALSLVSSSDEDTSPAPHLEGRVKQRTSSGHKSGNKKAEELRPIPAYTSASI